MLRTPNIMIKEPGMDVTFVPSLKSSSMAEREHLPFFIRLSHFIIQEASIIAIASLLEASLPTQIPVTCNMLGSRKTVELTVNAIIIF